MFRLAVKRFACHSRNLLWNTTRSLSTEEKIHKFDTENLFTYSEQEGYVRHSPYGDATIPNIPLHHLVWENFHNCENKIAFVSIFECYYDHCTFM